MLVLGPREAGEELELMQVANATSARSTQGFKTVSKSSVGSSKFFCRRGERKDKGLTSPIAELIYKLPAGNLRGIARYVLVHSRK